MLLNCGVGEGSWESLGLQGDPTSPSQRRSVLGVHWKDWCWSWNSNTLATSCEELTHWKRPWCWEGLGAGGEEDDRGWDGWMASLTWWAWVWINSGSLWWTGRPGVPQFMGSQRVGHDWATELNWKHLPTMQKTWVQSLGWEDFLEMGWQPTPVLLPGKSHGQRSLVGCSPRGCEESDMIEPLHFHFLSSLCFATAVSRGKGWQRPQTVEES